MSHCSNCGATVPDGAKFCSYCGADSTPTTAEYTHAEYQQPNYQNPPTTGFSQNNAAQGPYQAPPKQYEKDRIAAGVLAILLGGLGVHKFYLGNIGMGIVYLIFSFTAIPSLIGLIEGIIYLTKTDEQFYQDHVLPIQAGSN